MFFLREYKGFIYTCMFGVALILVSMIIGYVTLPSARTAKFGYAPEQISFRYEGADTIVDISHLYQHIISPMGHHIVYGDVIELEVDGEITFIKYCHWDCGDMNSSDCPFTGHPGGYVDVSYNLGEITGTPPKVRARTRYVSCGGEGTDYGPWSPLVDAVPSQPLPLVEIATVIGVGGIAVAVLNNYWSGRREKQMTDVTRSAAVDERFMELYDASRETEFQRTQAEVLYQYEWTDYDDFLAKYGPRSNVDAWAKIQSTAQYYEGIGVLVRTDSVSLDQVYQLLGTQIVDVWEKLGEIILERRKRELNQQIFSAFESLYYAIKNYQQQRPSPKDDVRVHKFE
jgi:hypothetical protein